MRGRVQACGLLMSCGLIGSACMTKPNPIWNQQPLGGASAASQGASDGGPADDPNDMTGGQEPSAGSQSGASSVGSEGSTSDGVDTGSTGAVAPMSDQCAGPTVIGEAFVGLPLDAGIWDEFTDVGVTTDAQGGQMHVGVSLALTPSPDDVESAYWIATTWDAVPASGSAGLEVVDVPPEGVQNGEVTIGLRDGVGYYHLTLVDGRLAAVEQSPEFGYVVVRSQPYDHDQQRWLRLVFDAGTGWIEYETSSDGAAWDPFASIQAQALSFDVATLRVAIGAWQEAIDEPNFATVDNVFLCG